jgi:tetratricopeptide (TPR) repeat protein/transglutaminase-like putative cysteine protease
MRAGWLVPIVVCSVGAVSVVAQQEASPGDYHREASVLEQSRTTWRFENDGTGRKDTYIRVKIESAAGIERWGQLVLGYNAANERLEITSVRVRKPDGTIVTASADAVQDLSSPVERVAPVYTDAREKHVTVPGLRPGDSLEFTSSTTLHTAVAANEFWAEYDFAKAGVVLDEELRIDVPADRTVTVKTRAGLDVAIATHDGRRIYTWRAARLGDVHDRKPTSTRAKKNPEPAAVRLTTFRDWDAVGRWYAQLERTPKTPTAAIREKAAALTAGRSADRERLEALYDFVAENFRYVSLSFGTGRYQPHAAADVLRNQYGDCKDKHTLLASLADAAGMRASAVLINSRADIDPDVPSPSQFDHVITRAMVGERAVWLDTTAEVAPFGLLAPQLRKKRALLIDGESARLVETPEESPVPHSSAVRIDASLDDAGLLSARVTLAFSGDFELAVRTLFRRRPKAEWKTILDSMMVHERLDSEQAEWEVSDPAALATPFTIEYRTQKPNFVTSSRKQQDIDLPLVYFLSIERDTDDDDEAVDIGSARRSTYNLRLTLPASYSTHRPLSVAVVRDYAEYRAEYSLDGHILTAERTLTVRQPRLPRDRRDDYGAFSRVVSRDLKQQLALERETPAAADAARESNADELYSSGYDALEDGNYPQAVALLKRATEIDPKHRRAWDQLGRAYVDSGQLDAAIAALQNQVEINAYDLYAYNNLGRAYGAQHRFAEAEAAYRKQIEINPLDPYAHTNLGELYVAWHKDAAAVVELEDAIVISPKNATARIRLGQAYLRLGQHERALAAFERAVALKPDAASWNEIAYQLALHGTNLDIAHRYAESAVSSMTIKARNVSLAHMTRWDFYYTAELAADWDTLGWVYFAEGNLDQAEKFVRAGWVLLQQAEVGDHLGQIYEKLGRRDDAIRLYALALNAERPDDTTRQRLAALVGDGHVDAVVREHRDDLERDRTIRLDRSGPAGAQADVLLLLTAQSAEDVTFVKGDDRLRPLVDDLRSINSKPVFPDGGSAKILRRGTLSCPSGPAAGACHIVLMLPRDAQLADRK